MSSIELFSHGDRFQYRAHIISSATCANVLCLVLTFLSPFLLTYYTGGFTIVESVYSEQPKIDNNINYVATIETNDVTTPRYFVSSYGTLNRDFLTGVLFGSSSESQTDTDGDGLIDQFVLSLDVILPSSTATINNINLWLVFQYELRQRQRIRMETLALASFIPSSTLTAQNSKNITIYGRLNFQQRQPIQNAGSDLTYQGSIIDVNNLTTSGMRDILDAYFQRTYYTTFEQEYVSITPRSSTLTTRIEVNVIVNVGRQAIRYIPSFWQEFKWGWIQYIYTLVPFLVVFNRLKLFLFSNGLVRVLGPLSAHSHSD